MEPVDAVQNGLQMLRLAQQGVLRFVLDSNERRASGLMPLTIEEDALAQQLIDADTPAKERMLISMGGDRALHFVARIVTTQGDGLGCVVRKLRFGEMCVAPPSQLRITSLRLCEYGMRIDSELRIAWRDLEDTTNIATLAWAGVARVWDDVGTIYVQRSPPYSSGGSSRGGSSRGLYKPSQFWWPGPPKNAQVLVCELAHEVELYGRRDGILDLERPQRRVRIMPVHCRVNLRQGRAAFAKVS